MLINKIITQNGKEFLKVSKKCWISYLKFINSDYKSIYSEIESKNNCGLKQKYSNMCYSCNSEIGEWKNSCAYIIQPINLMNYSYLFFESSREEENILIEIDRNDDNKTI